MSTTVTVIIPTFNTERFLKDTIASVVGQDYRPIEVVVVDDGSSDNTVALARKLLAEAALPHHVFTALNGGQNIARNIGLGIATGELIKFLDHDDVLPPWAIRTQVEALEASGADLLMGSIERFNGEKADEFFAGKSATPPMPASEPVETGHPIETVEKFGPTFNEILVRAELIRKAGGFCPRLGTCEEFHLFGRIALTTPDVRICYQAEPAVLYKRCFDGSLAVRYRKENSTVRNWGLAACEELARDILKQGGGLDQPWKETILDKLYLGAMTCYRDGLRGQALGAIETWSKAGRSLPSFQPAFHERLHRLLGFGAAERLLERVRRLRDRVLGRSPSQEPSSSGSTR